MSDAAAKRTENRPWAFVVAGEPSGDLHGAHLLEAWAARSPAWRFRGYGGRRMAAVGFEVLEDLPREAIMGIFPVIAALPKIRGWFRRAVQILEQERPDALILIDYPGFNLRLAAKAKALGIPVIYYISPQVWAWNRKRVKKIARDVDLMIAILPFEKDFYEGSGLRCEYVGNPLVDHLAKVEIDRPFVESLQETPGSPRIGLFPGSRQHVVESLAPDFFRCIEILRTTPGLEQARGIVAAADQSLADRMRTLPGFDEEIIQIVVGKTYEVMQAADLCLSASGTTTLELALSSKPTVLAYRVSAPSYALGRALIRVPHIGLVNLVAGREVVPEHIGVRSLAEGLSKDVAALWNSPEVRNAMLSGMKGVQEKLAGPGAYDRAAAAMLSYLAESEESEAGDASKDAFKEA